MYDMQSVRCCLVEGYEVVCLQSMWHEQVHAGKGKGGTVLELWVVASMHPMLYHHPQLQHSAPLFVSTHACPFCMVCRASR